MTRRRLLPAIVVVLAVAGAAAQQTAPAYTADRHDQEPPRQPVRDSRCRRKHDGVRDASRRRARRHQAPEQRRGDPEPGAPRHRQAGDDDHQHAFAPDDIGSNEYFPASVDVVTHKNTRKWMAANPRVASNQAAMPDRTFTDRMSLGSGDDRIELYYFGAGHTNGDAFVVFPARRAMCAGDMFAWKMAPLIDPMAGGSVLALPDTLEKAVNGIPNVDTVIEGHGDVNTWGGFRDYAQFNRALVDAAKAGMGQETAEEIAAGVRPKFPVFTKEELLTDMEYGATPLSRAVINVNVTFQELGKR